MSVCGNYVTTFAEASHALPNDMHMSADYPFMLPRIESISDGTVTIIGRGGVRGTGRIEVRKGLEFFRLGQKSSFELMFNLPETVFEFLPFKDRSCEAISPAQSEADRQRRLLLQREADDLDDPPSCEHDPCDID